ncbi:O-antigen ligase family protein [Streptomyces sp. NPDC047981]|uniref:O-antigen ligase family protein n=1 Tax=Streptomyces sp. NPDC047981 TaxID=3154610 RepID=UPI00342B160D
MAASAARGAVVRERGSRGVDVAGVLVLGSCVLWSLISAGGREARPEGVLLAVLALTAGYACGRITGSLLPVAVALVAALVALGLALASGPGVPGATPVGSVPTGHTGAAAALLVIATGAACCAASAAGSRPARLLSGGLAVAVAGSALVLGSVAGFVASAAVLLCSLAAVRMRRRLLGLVGLALATGLVVGASWAVAEDRLPEGLSVSLEGPLTGHRVLLWQDAVELAKENPVLGVGPDRFGARSATARETFAADGKPHSAALQQAAEQGLPGVALLGATYGWLLWGLWSSPRPTAVVLTAGAALTALAALAAVGNALSFTPVTACAGLLAGLATAGAGGRTSPVDIPVDAPVDGLVH